MGYKYEHQKCQTSNCYRVATIYGYCLVCWNKLSLNDRNRTVRHAVEYGKWQIDELEDNLIEQIKMQKFDGIYHNTDMSGISKNDFYQANYFGMYFPPKDRVFYAGSIDPRNDGRIFEASVSIPADSAFKFKFLGDTSMGNAIADGIERDQEWKGVIQQTVYIRKINAAPKGYLCSANGDWFVLLYGKYVNDLTCFDFHGYKFPKEKGLFYEKNYFKIDWAQEKINLAIKRGLNFTHDGVFLRYLSNRVRWLASLAISAEADSRFLWHVRAFKKVNNGKYLQGNVRFGVYGEHVKSLFFARDLPITSTGRKKPILHWVAAHKRRLQDGKDIDIEKYLRGTRMLQIGDTTFMITKPCEKEEYDFAKWARKNAIHM